MKSINKPVKIGLIGCGNVSVHRHLPVLKTLKEAEIVAVADIDPECLNRVADKFQIEKRFVDYTALLQEPSVEAVGICVPTQSHFKVAFNALDEGKHLLVEKPLAISLDEADRLINQAAKTDRKVMVGFNKRWHHLIRQARDIIQKGMLGPIGLMNTVFSTGHHNRYIPEWRTQRKAGGGTLIEDGSHFYDLCRFLFQSEIQEVISVSFSSEKYEDEPGVVTAQNASGIMLNCVLSDFLPNHFLIEIFGRDCLLRVSPYRFDGIELIPLHSNEGDMKNRLRNMARFFKELPHGLLNMRNGGDYQASFKTQWKHFIYCIRRDTPVECTFDDGRRALQVALAAVKSASIGQSVKIAGGPREITPLSSDTTFVSQRDLY